MYNASQFSFLRYKQFTKTISGFVQIGLQWSWFKEVCIAIEFKETTLSVLYIFGDSWSGCSCGQVSQGEKNNNFLLDWGRHFAILYSKRMLSMRLKLLTACSDSQHALNIFKRMLSYCLIRLRACSASFAEIKNSCNFKLSLSYHK